MSRHKLRFEVFRGLISKAQLDELECALVAEKSARAHEVRKFSERENELQNAYDSLQRKGVQDRSNSTSELEAVQRQLVRV